MNDEELATYFQAHKGDTSEWSDKPVKADVQNCGVVYTNDGNWPPIRSKATPAKVTWKGEDVDRHLGLK